MNPPVTAPVVDPSVPRPVPVVNPPSDRQAAYNQLLQGAAVRGDNGDSSQAMATILNRVDMNRPDRLQGYWDQRNAAYTDASSKLLSATGAAQQAHLGQVRRARAASAAQDAAWQQIQTNYPDWYQQYLTGLGSPTPLPQYGLPARPGSYRMMYS